VLRAIGAALGFRDLCAGMFSCVTAVVVDTYSNLRILFFISSGVVQGCALAATFFAFSTDPMLNKFDQRIHTPGLGTVCACADDIGLALRFVWSLAIVSEIFAHAEYLTLLKLKPAKCVLVPLFRSLPRDFQPPIKGRSVSMFSNTAEFSDLARWCSLWLAQFLPAWSSFQVASEALYLGAFLGPGAGRLHGRPLPTSGCNERATLLTPVPRLWLQSRSTTRVPCSHWGFFVSFFFLQLLLPKSGQ